MGPLLYPDGCMSPAPVPLVPAAAILAGAPALPAPLASAGETAFYVIFGVFVVAMLVLIVIVVTWAVRHDLAGRRAWRARQEARARDEAPPPPEHET